MPSRGRVSSADGNRRGGGESVSGGIKASFNVKNGKTNLNNRGEGFRLRTEIEEESERERRNKKVKTKHVS